MLGEYICAKTDSPLYVKLSRFRSLGIFGLWNLESGKFFPAESGMLGLGIRYSAKGMRNPTNDWRRESKFH